MPVAEEAGFLFGDDIVAQIYSLSGKIHKGLSFPDEDFIEPFKKYLKFEDENPHCDVLYLSLALVQPQTRL